MFSPCSWYVYKVVSERLLAAIGHHHTPPLIQHKALATSYVYLLPMKVSVERQLALMLH